ncbi:hypothetical protein RFI_17192 [Reticulomyxa filosa]|uniref:Uncharacterized protein n=1 Tax=Reticulomyxa filosa TaxID=46433 RepID=X6N1T6_RETFI|nr:hypothetical protein RFI_17192 [Reticulomyxa filosa]|eukprot:ETO20026.1 hypothetical protein RFI_17192 [Reticulomyxa filosa]
MSRSKKVVTKSYPLKVQETKANELKKESSQSKLETTNEKDEPKVSRVQSFIGKYDKVGNDTKQPSKPVSRDTFCFFFLHLFFFLYICIYPLSVQSFIFCHLFFYCYFLLCDNIIFSRNGTGKAKEEPEQRPLDQYVKPNGIPANKKPETDSKHSEPTNANPKKPWLKNKPYWNEKKRFLIY